ncbi:antibiotic biosynthesis monooxygenase family protein [Solicola gregarius]|uniref:Antibiotic biosynthesis monooxygenase n=1 Tax=Solicola gregarius TaxID=2908642 RepID=A0AA46YMH8_9ACTN|nr:antibiotic biosynthesis monooxygenase family protein [Solicola gregarius]UYM05773.1 antibiotic biosynthesis monooxygenase [Solicola gregarius]
MIVVTRYRVTPGDASSFATRAHTALDALAQQRGYRTGGVGRNVDDESLWTLTTLWDDTGSYRRALSSTDVKLAAVPLLSEAIAEPTAYEEI